MKNILLIIDPQNDFVDYRGALSVLGADGDADKIVNLIDNGDWDEIHVSLDSHHTVDLSHSICWEVMGEDGSYVNAEPFSMVTLEDFVSGKFRTKYKYHKLFPKNYIIDYLYKLQKTEYAHILWPPHCIIGSWGTAIYPSISKALQLYEANSGNNVNYVYKGQNPLMEHYGIFGPETGEIDIDFVNKLRNSNLTVVGEAQSHCVNTSVRQFINTVSKMREDKTHLTVLKDCMSNVTGFEANGEAFLEFVQENDGIVTTVENFLGHGVII